MITNITQFAIVTPNCDETVLQMQEALNLGPLKIWDFKHPEIFDTTIDGKPEAWTMKLAFGWLGGMQFEVIEPTGGATLYQEFLNRTKRAGVQHLLVDRGKVPYPKMKNQLAQAGMPIVNEAKTNVAVKIGPFTLPPLPMFLAKSTSTIFGYASTFDTLKTVIETSKYPPGVEPRTGIRMGVPSYWSAGDKSKFEELPAESLITDIEGFVVLVQRLDDVKNNYTKLFGVSTATKNNELYFRLEAKFLKVVQPEKGSFYASILTERGEGVQILRATPRQKTEQSNEKIFRSKGFSMEKIDEELSLFSQTNLPFLIEVAL
jgi:Glyoxalase/Bleomycin resistance protein/Dioxygenase superfamily